MTWFDSDDNNCILKQVQYMLYDTLIYKTILQARLMASKDEVGVRKVNGAMHWLLDKCFFTNQLMIIRRLTDSKGTDVRSIYRLLQSMQENLSLLTRENYFSVHKEYEYDYSETKRKCEEYEREQEKAIKFEKAHFYFIPDELDWERSERMHRVFDVLSQTDSSDRKTSDKIARSIFQELLSKLKSCKSLRDHVDTFVAHTLDDKKRKELGDEARITYEQLWKAQETICSITHFISLYLLNRVEYDLLPMPHPSLLKYLELPLISNDQKAKLCEVEKEFRTEIRTWSIKLDDVCM